ncbi:hypothetical protein N7492_009946 [Penicillium capsulatum]|uniref:Uncharacterized protein n=1 Tax=Penicillium capsulatum TaxID=69766 RepID=A0A9W9HNL1_9EURO|nr:hypothetical protein N7492_009946 [Penicillium capsulatum]KAJ6112457.1 hypothetical protein N7512_007781 [Penicillium capsulatum]
MPNPYIVVAGVRVPPDMSQEEKDSLDVIPELLPALEERIPDTFGMRKMCAYLAMGIIGSIRHPSKARWPLRIVDALVRLNPQHYATLEMMATHLASILNFLTESIEAYFPEPEIGPHLDEVQDALAITFALGKIEPLAGLMPGDEGSKFPRNYQTATELLKECDDLAGRIFVNYRDLEKTWTYARTEIQARWKTKTLEERFKILDMAWPNIHDLFREGFREYVYDMGGFDSKPQRWKTPQINLEELGDDVNLISLLHIRATNPPSVFSYVDTQSWKVGLHLERFACRPFNIFVMALTGQESEATYGLPYRKDEKPYWDTSANPKNGIESVRAGEGVLAIDGLVTLEVQGRIYEGLFRCCEALLSPEEKDQLERMPLPTDNKVTAGDIHIERPWPTAISEALFYQPTNPHRLTHLIEEVESKLSDAQDHLWSLREDPLYLTSTIKQVHEHLPKRLKVRVFQTLPSVANKADYAIAIKHTIVEAFASIVTWTAIQERLKALDQTLQTPEVRNLSYKEFPSESLRMEFAELRQILDYFERGSLEYLVQCIQASPRYRLNFQREVRPETVAGNDVVDTSSGTRVIDVDYSITYNEMGYNKYVKDAERRFQQGKSDERPVDMIGDWRFKYIDLLAGGCRANQDVFTDNCSTPIFLDELRRLVEEDEFVEPTITAYVQRQLLDMAFIADCYTHMSLFIPWSQCSAATRWWRREECKARYKDIVAPVEALRAALDKSDAWLKTATALYQGFEYPIDETPTKQVVDKLRLAEQRLADFWKGFDRAIDNHPSGWPALLASLFKGDRQVRRTPKWQRPAPRPRSPPVPQPSAPEPPAAEPPASESPTPEPSVPESPVPGPSSPTPGPSTTAGRGVKRPAVLEITQEDIERAAKRPKTEAGLSSSEPPKAGGKGGKKGGKKSKKKTEKAPVVVPIKVAEAAPQAAPQAGPAQQEQQPHPLFQVNANDYEVFQSLFHVPGQARGGSVDWKSFCGAMTRIGFGITSAGGGGSARTFTPPASIGTRNISIHNPHHPRPKLENRNCRWIGNRLKDYYNLDASSFELS